MSNAEALNFIVCYNTGHVVRQKSIHGDYLYQIEIGVIRHIIDLNDNKIWKVGPEGIAVKSELKILVNP